MGYSPSFLSEESTLGRANASIVRQVSMVVYQEIMDKLDTMQLLRQTNRSARA